MIENVAVGTTVGTVKATDPDAAGEAFGQQRYYFKNGSSTGTLPVAKTQWSKVSLLPSGIDG